MIQHPGLVPRASAIISPMTPARSIQQYDPVRVSFHGAQTTLCAYAMVLYMPCATGDSWVFQDLLSGTIHHVSEGCTVTRLREPETDMALAEECHRIHFVKDGNQVCCQLVPFVNLQESSAGFGLTKLAAFADLRLQEPDADLYGCESARKRLQEGPA